jgi:hypothetical protein
MKSRELTINEIFPIAHQQDLIKKQSEYFVSNALADGSIESGYKNMPICLPSSPSNSPLIEGSNAPQKYIGTYLKNNWRPLLIVLIIGSVATYVYLKSKEKKEKKSGGTQYPKILNYNYPKKSI